MLQELAEQLLLAVKQEQPVDELVAQLEALPPQSLDELTGDSSKLAFWINTYNAWYQILRTQHGIAPPRIYTDREITLGTHDRFSLDEIEHGILRRVRWKYFAGYLPNPWARRRLRELMVDRIDWRIHFALNCGAQSCPPIAFYTADRLDSQLDLATASYLESETSIDHETRTIYLPKLFQWFSADFGGKSGIRRLLASRFDAAADRYRLVSKPYNWDEQLGNFS